MTTVLCLTCIDLQTGNLPSETSIRFGILRPVFAHPGHQMSWCDANNKAFSEVFCGPAIALTNLL